MGSTRNSGLFVVIFLFAAWASQATSRTLPGQVLSMTERHEQWMAQYGRTYKDAAEKEYRFQIFKTNVELIESFNSAGHRSYRLGINAFTDLTNEEFKSSRNGYKPTREKASDSTSFMYEMVTAPAGVDWRKKGAVTPIKDQGECGVTISVAIDAGVSDFRFYSGGVFTGDCCTDLDHGVTAVGYGTADDGTKYWLMKNSWGTSWGEDGYIRMQRDVDAEEGLCGIAMVTSYPTA